MPPSQKKSKRSIQSDTSTLDAKTSSKIMSLARAQQQELLDPDLSIAPTPYARGPRISLDDDEQDPEEWQDYESTLQGAYDALEINPQDAALIQKFMNPEKKQTSLSDLIMAKMNASLEETHAEEAPLNPKVIEVYNKVGSILSRYRSGPLPKTFKIIPSLKNWEEILFLTNPAGWTPQAVYQATRIFVSNLKDKMAQRFFSLVLLDRVRDDIFETKKLNYHLYMAVKKGLYKPAAFFKGFLFPLCELGNASLREAAIIGSVLSKVSIPVLHSAAALLKIAEMDYTGPNSLFIRILLDKKYALPFKVVDALVFHFLGFKQDTRDMPVLWHQSLLVFAQRYKSDLTPEQKEALLDLIRVKTHPGISPEIRRELVNSTCRGEMMQDQDAMELVF